MKAKNKRFNRMTMLRKSQKKYHRKTEMENTRKKLERFRVPIQVRKERRKKTE